MGMGDCSQSRAVPLYHSFFLTFFPYSSVSCLLRAAGKIPALVLEHLFPSSFSWPHVPTAVFFFCLWHFLPFFKFSQRHHQLCWSVQRCHKLPWWAHLCPAQGGPWPLLIETTPAAPLLPKPCCLHSIQPQTGDFNRNNTSSNKHGVASWIKWADLTCFCGDSFSPVPVNSNQCLLFLWDASVLMVWLWQYPLN